MSPSSSSSSLESAQLLRAANESDFGAAASRGVSTLISLMTLSSVSATTGAQTVVATPSTSSAVADDAKKGLIQMVAEEDGLPKPTTEEINSFYFYKTEQFTVLWLLFTTIVLGNSAVLVTLLVNKSRKSRMNFFIRQLAIADLSVGLINVSTDIVWRITISWYAGNVLCKLIRFLQAVVTFSSTYVLVALSIDRYDAITHPMNFSGSWKRAKLLIIIAWLLSALFALPTMFLFEEKPIEGLPQCWIDLKPWQWRVYMTLVSLALFFVPAVIIGGCYAVIVWTIWSKSKLLIPIGNIPTGHERDENKNRARRSAEDDTRRASSRGIIPRAKIKTVKMTFVIVFVFVMCWSPYIVFDLLQVYDYIPTTQTNIAIATLIQSLAPLNSAANPVIYCLFSTHLCRNLRKLPPCSWISGCMSVCFPGMQGSGHCLGYGGGDSSGGTATVTTSLTHSSRRSGSASSLRHTVRYEVQPQQTSSSIRVVSASVGASVVACSLSNNLVSSDV